MVVLNRIYTRTGDKGDTALGSGERVPKTASAHPGLWHGGRDQCHPSALRGSTPAMRDFAKLDAMLARIQNDLFDLGADLCVPDTGKDLGYEPLRMIGAPDRAARARDRRAQRRPAAAALLRAAGRPSGGRASSSLPHRVPARRAPDRRAWPPIRTSGVSDGALAFVNRLSDFFFVASRWVNAQEGGDVLWVKGANR